VALATIVEDKLSSREPGDQEAGTRKRPDQQVRAGGGGHARTG